jgi:superfamily I DNA/RNA helicase
MTALDEEAHGIEDLLSSEQCSGDALLAQASLNRARLDPVEKWHPNVRAFDRAWQEWLDENELVDFTGMLSRPLGETDAAPGRPQVIFVDEAQDCSALDLKLVRYWARSCDFVMLCGDGDQSIFAFRGGSIDAFLGGDVLPEHNYSLTQSYRVPRAIHAAATGWVSQVSKRYAVDYLPRDAEGRYEYDPTVRGSHGGESLVERLQAHLMDHKDAMVLAPCSHTLRGVTKALKEAGVLFHNPYRLSNGAWNPMRGGVERLQALVMPLAYKLTGAKDPRSWRWDELWRWVEPLSGKGVLQKGAKKLVRYEATGEASDIVPSVETLRRDVFTDAGMTSLVDSIRVGASGLIRWHREHVLSAWSQRFAYAYSVAESDPARLLEQPRVVVGTVHSVKGGQAESVFLIPELSVPSREAWLSGAAKERDEIRRMIYVGMTRASQSLTVCGGKRGRCVQVPGS